MGVRCSMLGHDYGDPAVEREREERGAEVVRTAKRVQRCDNCGHERTISENTEITSLEAAAGVVRTSDGTVVADGAAGETDGGVERPHASEAEHGGPHDGANTAKLSSPTGPHAGNTIAVGASDEHGEVADQPDGTDTATRPDGEPGDGHPDGVDTLRTHDTDPESTGRAPGEWPAEPTSPDADRTNRSRSESGGRGRSRSLAAAWSDDARFDDGGASDSAATGEHRTPDGTERGTQPAAGSHGLAGTGPAPFACASCEFSAVVADSSLRAGDICPECGRGYLGVETRKG